MTLLPKLNWLAYAKADLQPPLSFTERSLGVRVAVLKPCRQQGDVLGLKADMCNHHDAKQR